MRLELKIRCDNAAFEENPREEVARILREVADKLVGEFSYGDFYETLRDINGNDVGRVKLHRRE
jgi:hypothetical protein